MKYIRYQICHFWESHTDVKIIAWLVAVILIAYFLAPYIPAAAMKTRPIRLHWDTCRFVSNLLFSIGSFVLVFQIFNARYK